MQRSLQADRDRVDPQERGEPPGVDRLGYAEVDSRNWDLNPDSPTEFDVRIEDLPAGDHTIYAVLFREDSGRRETFEDSKRVSVR